MKPLIKDCYKIMNNRKNSVYHSFSDFIKTCRSLGFAMTGFNKITNLATVPTNLLLTLLMVVLLSSCDSNLKPETQGKKMETFFKNNNTSLPKLQHQRGNALLATKQALNASPVRNQVTKQASSLSASSVRTQATEQRLNADFIRTQATELESRFPKLPNPILNMFIYPHLTQGGNPVPGYTTHFNLYKVDHYALPGEYL
jgi:conjugative transfer region lipoprotein (TIGR03751 family)